MQRTQESEISRSNGSQMQRSQFPWSIFSSWSRRASSSHSSRACALLPQLLPLLLPALSAPGVCICSSSCLDGPPVVAPSNPMHSPNVNVSETSSEEHKSSKAVADSVCPARFRLVIPLCRVCSAEAGAFGGRAACPLPNLSLDSWS
jgi:hypothetical protein